MFEYIDRELIIATALLLFSIGLLRVTKKKSVNWDIRFLLLLAVSLPFVQTYYLKTLATANIQSFKDAATQKCTLGDNDYRVSLKDGWEVDKNHFVKDSLLIRADKCEVYE